MAKPTPRRHANEPKPQVKTKIRKNDTVKVITTAADSSHS